MDDVVEKVDKAVESMAVVDGKRLTLSFMVYHVCNRVNVDLPVLYNVRDTSVEQSSRIQRKGVQNCRWCFRQAFTQKAEQVLDCMVPFVDGKPLVAHLTKSFTPRLGKDQNQVRGYRS